MKLLSVMVVVLVVSAAAASPVHSVTAKAVAEALHHISLDGSETYRVRDLRIRRGDVSIYLNEGVLSFATAVNGRRVAAVFTTFGVDAGDAEILVVPPGAAERASLASFAKVPNLDEHFISAIFFFTDGTAEELLAEIATNEMRKAPESAGQLAESAAHILQNPSAQVSTQAVSSILDPEPPSKGFFYAGIKGREQGNFDFLYEPQSYEPVTVGDVWEPKDGHSQFRLWTGYRPRNAAPYVNQPASISNYAIDACIRSDLSISATARFNWAPAAGNGRVLSFRLSKRMKVESAKIDGSQAETYQKFDPEISTVDADGGFLIISAEQLAPGRHHQIEVHYSGSIIYQVSEASYFVSERNLWYPHTETMFSNFDLTFRCPGRFGIASTGELISEEIADGVRTVHRRTLAPQQLAGFNIGEYQLQASDTGAYRLQCYAEKAIAADLNGIPVKGAKLLAYYTDEWIKLTNRTQAITPIPGNFGQGFPGIVYLGKWAYFKDAERPANLQTEQDVLFFSHLLLPHEIAHQWWGNMVTSGSYRSDWLMEAMANDSALDFLAHEEGEATANAILQQYRLDLGRVVDGEHVESSGPVVFGLRLLASDGLATWNTVVYEKGSWILHMLRNRLGPANFRKMQVALLREYSDKPVTNEEFQKLVSLYLPAGQPDRDLRLFFETWIYGTGIPKLHMNRSGTSIEVSGVGNDFAADLPLRCKSRNGSEQVHWTRVETGPNAVPAYRDAAACKLPSPLDFLYFPQ